MILLCEKQVTLESISKRWPQGFGLCNPGHVPYANMILPIMYIQPVAPGKPRNLIVVNSHTTSLIVTWEAPLCDNGIRTQYSVSFVQMLVYLCLSQKAVR